MRAPKRAHPIARGSYGAGNLWQVHRTSACTRSVNDRTRGFKRLDLWRQLGQLPGGQRQRQRAEPREYHITPGRLAAAAAPLRSAAAARAPAAAVARPLRRLLGAHDGPDLLRARRARTDLKQTQCGGVRAPLASEIWTRSSTVNAFVRRFFDGRIDFINFIHILGTAKSQTARQLSLVIGIVARSRKTKARDALA
ncbi:hypothetical protein EVAR_47257_1 [Eumeta japonica]|uniref:Uncharacterized protein n=1 Tax=Eumeta variegata TaxID=151549 RepID=A0A4C1XH99_EUMVA|nr:hypothetical protein EVAR_47257_1 [Eumeta japonica]